MVDYKHLSPAEIQEMIAPQRNDHLDKVFKDVDGREVTDKKQLLEPGEELVPSLMFERLESPVTPNKRSDVLEDSTPFCLGYPCSTTRACVIMGCSACIYLDLIVIGAQCYIF